MKKSKVLQLTSFLSTCHKDQHYTTALRCFGKLSHHCWRTYQVVDHQSRLWLTFTERERERRSALLHRPQEDEPPVMISCMTVGFGTNPNVRSNSQRILSFPELPSDTEELRRIAHRSGVITRYQTLGIGAIKNFESLDSVDSGFTSWNTSPITRPFPSPFHDIQVFSSYMTQPADPHNGAHESSTD